MARSNHNTEKRTFKHLTAFDRGQIKAFLKQGKTLQEIANEIGCHKSTISREIKRGSVIQRRSDLTEHTVYFPDSGQATYEKNRSRCGAKYKLVQATEFIQFAIDQIKRKHWSPDAVCGYAKTQKLYDDHAMVCTKTLYHYIDLGSRAKGAALLTLTERKTRNEHILKIDQKTAECVKKAIQTLKRSYGSTFSKVFKTITADNGSEFSELSQELESDQAVYYTHPYTSCERGTNERHNDLIRRFIPKGKSIDNLDESIIAYVENWCNTLPRKILGYRSPQDVFQNELLEIA